MRKGHFLYFYYFILAATILYSINVSAKSRYLNKVFDNVKILRDIKYTSHNIDEYVKMDIYLPTDDNMNQRPAIIFAHGGAFLIGDKNDSTIRTLCKEFARRGYVTASINYRLAQYPSFLKMGYQAVQDGKTAVRYLKHFSYKYGIDPDYIFFGGISAGAITALNVAYLEDSEDIAGRDFKSLLGNFDYSTNHYSESCKVAGVINICGGVLDLLHIDKVENTPVISFHGTIDNIIPIDRGLPFTGYMSTYNSVARFINTLAPMEPVYGSRSIHQRLKNLNIKNKLIVFPGKGHKLLFNAEGLKMDSYDKIISSIENFLYDILKPVTPYLSGSTIVKILTSYRYAIDNPENFIAIWKVTGGRVLSKSNRDISIEWIEDTENTISVFLQNNLGIESKPKKMIINVTATSGKIDQTNNLMADAIEKYRKRQSKKNYISSFSDSIHIKIILLVLALCISAIFIFIGLHNPK